MGARTGLRATRLPHRLRARPPRRSTTSSASARRLRSILPPSCSRWPTCLHAEGRFEPGFALEGIAGRLIEALIADGGAWRGARRRGPPAPAPPGAGRGCD